MQIIRLKITDITPYENNAKLHPQEQIEQIKKSIIEFGNNDPIAIDENNVIIEGHGRYLALMQMGEEEIECIRLTHLTDEQKRAYILVHNKLTMNTDFDFNILDSELSNITNINMADFDFEIPDIDVEDFDTDFELPDGDKSEICQMTFTLHQKQKELIEYAMEVVSDCIEETFGNTNSNGNKLYEVIRQWAEQRK
jgi:hypothetical protein